MAKFSEMSSIRKFLFALGIVYIVLSVVQIAFGALVGLAAGSTEVLEALGQSGIEKVAQEIGTTSQTLVSAIGVIVAVAGVWCLLVGILGIRGAKNPAKLGLATVLNGISAVVCVLGIGSAVASGSAASGIVAAALPVASFVCCLLARKEA